jgi:hypothetical protein
LAEAVNPFLAILGDTAKDTVLGDSEDAYDLCLGARAFATKLGGEHPIGLTIILRVLKDRQNAAEVGPLIVLMDHADHVTDLGSPMGNHGQYPCYRTEVGEHENSAGPYGTFDQGGNVHEWNEALSCASLPSRWLRGIRGGAYADSSSSLEASFRGKWGGHSSEYFDVGFRMVRVPATMYEPGALFLRVTIFRRLLPTFKGEKFLTIQVTSDEPLMGHVRLPLE